MARKRLLKINWPKIEKEWQTYLKKTRGCSRMTKGQWLVFNYPKLFTTTRTAATERRLRQAGLTEEEIKRVRD